MYDPLVFFILNWLLFSAKETSKLFMMIQVIGRF